MARRPRKPNLEIEVVYVPDPDYDEHLNGALNVLADALAERLIAKARQQVADELGIRLEQLGRAQTERIDLEEELLQGAGIRTRPPSSSP